MKLRVGIAATALSLVTAAGCAIQPAATVPATSDSPSPVLTQPSEPATKASGVVLSKAQVGTLTIGRSTQQEAVEYLTATFGQEPERWDTVCDGPAGTGSYTPLSWGALEIEINDQGVLASWSVNPFHSTEGLALESGLAFDATLAEVEAAAPNDKLKSGGELSDSGYVEWTLQDTSVDTTFHWQTPGDVPDPSSKAILVSGPGWAKCLEGDG